MNTFTYQPELNIGIDEMTIVLQSTEKVAYYDWLNKVESMLEEFLSLSMTEKILGKLVPMCNKKPAGYTNALTIEDVPYYFAVAYHEDFQSMGVCIKFSAYALATYLSEYEKQFNQQITVSDYLKMIQSDIYSTRLSRIDMVADYKNYGYDLKPNTIYSKIKQGKYTVVNHKLHRTRQKFSAIEKNGAVETFYIGSKVENTKSILRCYDKKEEQLSKSGFRLQEAIHCTSWTRFEVSFKNKYAHQITDALLNEVNTPLELQQFIAQKITEKYIFYDVDANDATEFSTELLSVISNNNFSYLRSEKPQDNALKQSINHLIKGSGLFPTLFKIRCVWGEDAEHELIEHLYNLYETTYVPDALKDKEIRHWLKIHKPTLLNQKLSDSF